jgi:HNH endonuclease
MRSCSVSGCTGAYYGKGLCGKHYQRLRVTGTLDDGPRAPAPLEVRFWRQVAKAGPDDCWLWTGKGGDGRYGSMQLGGKGTKHRLVHRLSWELANGGSPPDGMVVMHTCDTPLCVNPAHLVLGTFAENTADMIAKGRKRTVAKVGNENGKALLTPEMVRYIRASDKSQAELARELGVDKNTVRGVLIGRTWSHVT